MKLPSHAECLTLLQEYRTPHHVVQHSLMVNRVGVFLAKALRDAGKKIDVDAVDRAALLHDMLRVVNFDSFDPERFTQTITADDLATWRQQKTAYGALHHATAARMALSDRGYKKLGTLIEAHRADAIHGKTAKLNSWEKKCLYYADKRVAHTKIVTIPERFAEWGMRHHWSAAKKHEVEKEMQKVLELERTLFADLSITPASIKALQQKR